MNNLNQLEPHIYIKLLKKTIIKSNKKFKKMLDKVNKIYVMFNATTHIPESVELHYHSPDLEDQYSFNGSRVMHKVFNYPKNALKFYKELKCETDSLVLIYNNWKSTWSVHESKGLIES